MTEFDVRAPATGADIAAELNRLHDESVAFYATLPTATFVAPQGAAWSPADHVRHLTKSMRALNRGLRLPLFVLRWRFGRASRPSRSYDGVVAAYRKRLETFDGRNNPFAPATSPAVDTEAWRATVMSYHATAVAELIRHARRINEDKLDKIQVPHPLLGKMTLREMLFFMLYHNLHHVRLVAARVEAVR
ncbi:MAG TPA: DinB family protein [Longimicrobiales bacterium]